MNALNPIPNDATKLTIDPAELRRSLSCFPTGVTIVTTTGRGGQPVGVTISSFNSVSLDPPLILWSLALKAGSLEDFRGAAFFAVNVLSEEQGDLPRIFSSAVEDRFSGLDWETGMGGAPVLQGCSAAFECRTYARHDGGDHEIFLGEVLRHQSSQMRPMLYAKGRIGGLPEHMC